MKLKETVIILLATLFVAPIVHANDPEAFAAIWRKREALGVAISQGDAVAISKFYADDCEYLSVDGEMLRSPAAIRGKLQSHFDRASKPRTQKFTRVSIRHLTENLVLEDCTWEMKRGEAGGVVKGRDSAIWKKVDGEWMKVTARISRDGGSADLR